MHYVSYVFQERRLPRRFDARWFTEAYPMAAFEIAQGDYADGAHHYWAIGKARGYQAFPGQSES